MASTTGLGTFERLARVCRRIRFPSRQVFLRRTAGGLERLGMTWTRMDMAAPGTWQQHMPHKILYISSLNYAISFSTWQ